jgi:hypothetical protein
MEDVLNNKNCHDASNLDDNPSPEIKSHNVVAMLEDTINDDDSQSVNSLIDGSTTSNHELESHEDEEDPFEEIYQRIQRIQLQETTAATIDDNFIVDADGSIDPPSDGQPNKQPITSPCVLPSDSNTVATDQGDGISIYSEPSNNASSGTHSFEQFQMSIEEEITKIDSLTIHDKSMLSLIVHCNRMPSWPCLRKRSRRTDSKYPRHKPGTPSFPICERTFHVLFHRLSTSPPA